MVKPSAGIRHLRSLARIAERFGLVSAVSAPRVYHRRPLSTHPATTTATRPQRSNDQLAAVSVGILSDHGLQTWVGSDVGSGEPTPPHLSRFQNVPRVFVFLPETGGSVRRVKRVCQIRNHVASHAVLDTLAPIHLDWRRISWHLDTVCLFLRNFVALAEPSTPALARWRFSNFVFSSVDFTHLITAYHGRKRTSGCVLGCECRE